MRLLFISGIAVLLLSCFSQAVFADAYSGTFNLGEVVVSGEAGAAVEKVAALQEVTAEEIEQRGVRTLDQALELVPGINVRTGGKGVARIDMRGMVTRHLKVLLDGIPINSTYDGQFDPSMIPVENIEKIKVSYGGSSVLYGQGAIAGIINIITKKGKPGIHAGMIQEIGEDVSYDSRYTFSGATDRADFFLSAKHYKRDGFDLSEDYDWTSEENGGLRENTDKHMKNLFGRIGYTVTEKLRLGLTFAYTDGAYGYPPNTINDKEDPFAKTVKYERVHDSKNYMVQLSASYDMDGPLEFRAWGFLNRLNEASVRYDDDRYVSTGNTDIKGLYDQRAQTLITGLNFQTRCNLEKFGVLSIAFSGQKDQWDADGQMRDKFISHGGVFDEEKATTKIYYMRDIDSESDIKTYSMAAEYEVSLFDRLDIVLGYAHHWLSKDMGSNDSGGSFVTGFNYRLLEKTRFFGAVSRKIRFPSLSQLYDTTKGNPNLETERAYNYELGIEQQLPLNSMITLVGFVVDSKDYITKDDFTEINMNKEKYRIRGVEVSLNARPIQGLSLNAGYTYTDPEDQSESAVGEIIQYRPRHKLTFIGSYRFAFGLRITATMKHVDQQYFYSKKEPFQKKELNQYTLFNMKIAQDIKKHFTLYAGAKNIFDKDYETSYGVPRAGRFVYGGIKIKY